MAMFPYFSLNIFKQRPVTAAATPTAPNWKCPTRQKKLAEADLLALVDDKVVVAEAKSTDELDTGNQNKAARKRVLLAETFGAEEIILATTKEGWKEASISAMRTAVKDHVWKAMPRPRIREVFGLGTGEVKDRYIDAD